MEPPGLPPMPAPGVNHADTTQTTEGSSKRMNRRACADDADGGSVGSLYKCSPEMVDKCTSDAVYTNKTTVTRTAVHGIPHFFMYYSSSTAWDNAPPPFPSPPSPSPHIPMYRPHIKGNKALNSTPTIRPSRTRTPPGTRHQTRVAGTAAGTSCGRGPPPRPPPRGCQSVSRRG